MIFCYRDPKSVTGNFFIDEDVVVEAGVKDLVPYACNPGNYFLIYILKTCLRKIIGFYSL